MGPSAEAEVQAKSVTLERKTEHKKLIIFDVDETLIHCTINDGPEKVRES